MHRSQGYWRFTFDKLVETIEVRRLTIIFGYQSDWTQSLMSLSMSAEYLCKFPTKFTLHRICLLEWQQYRRLYTQCGKVAAILCESQQFMSNINK